MSVLVKKSGRTTHGSKYLKSLLVEWAWAASRTKDTYLSSKYRALVAIGHKILMSAYQVLKSGQKYVDLGKDYLAKRQERRQLQSALGKLHALGYSVSLEKAG